MTKAQLIKKISSLLKPREFAVKIGKDAYLYVTVEWKSWIHAEISKIEIESKSWKGIGLDSFKKTVPLDFSKLLKFDAEIVAACKESDRQAKAAKIKKYEYFEDILNAATRKNT